MDQRLRTGLLSTVVVLSLTAPSCGKGGKSSAGSGTGAGTSASSTSSSGAGGHGTGGAGGHGGATGTGGAGTGGAGTGGTGTGGTGTGGGPVVDPESVLMRSKHPNRDAHFVQPALTKVAAGNMAYDATFLGLVTGNVYAAPLYVADGPGGKGTFFVVTESNNVSALAEADGATVWTRNVGAPATQTGAGCGNIGPLGITGTPVVDPGSRTLFLDAVIADPTTKNIKTHEIHALSIDDGSERAGFPVDTSTVTSGGVAFDPVMQNQRGALLISGGTVYVPYGGHAGDCGTYHGWVIGVPIGNPAAVKGYATLAAGGGMWAPGGLASDGTNLFAATGNTSGASTWAQGESILRLQPGPAWSGQTDDYFSPSNWKYLDGVDFDLGGSGPLLVDVPGATPSALVVALGKNGVAYLLDRAHLGGIGTGNGLTGEGLVSLQVATQQIINVAASYRTASGVYVVLHVSYGGTSIGCPPGQAGDLVALRIGATAPPTLAVAWCADTFGQGSPIVTTTDGMSEAVVWAVGAELTKKLHGYDAETGAVIFDGGPGAFPGAPRRFNSPIAVHGRIIVAGDGGLYAFKSM